jgi:hypothetical protein
MVARRFYIGIFCRMAGWCAGGTDFGGRRRDVDVDAILVALTVWGALAVFRNDAVVGRIGNRIAVAGMILVPVALGGSWLFQDWAERQLAADGYVRCGVERVGRFPSLTLCARRTQPART